MAISLQTGIRQYNGDLSQYTGMLGGLVPDIHTLRSLNPLTDNRVICVMYRGPYFLMHYFAGKEGNAYSPTGKFGTYKKLLEYYNTGIQCNFNDRSLGTTTLQGGFAARSISIATTQNAQSGQQLTITVPELVGRPVADFHNMWVDGIADQITGLTTYHGLVAGSVDPETLAPKRIFAPNTGASEIALEPSPAWEVAEFLVIALDRSGARVDGAVMALGCLPQGKVGDDIFNSNATGSSKIQSLNLVYNCQFVQGTYINDLASRYVRQFSIYGNSMNLNPGAGDAFFTESNNTGEIDTAMFNNGKRPTLDAVQSGVGNAPIFKADQATVQRTMPEEKTITPSDHSQIYQDGTNTQPVNNPYATTASANN